MFTFKVILSISLFGRMQKGDEHCVALPSQVSAFGIDQIWEYYSYVVVASYVLMNNLSLN